VVLTTYLFVWMGRRITGVVACLVSCSRIAGASSIYLFWCLRLGSYLRCQSLCLFWIELVVEILPICRDLEIFMYCHIWSYNMYTWRCMLYVRCVVVWIFVHVIFLENFWRCSVYFLNNCIIHVFYRFNRNRVLHVSYVGYCCCETILGFMISFVKYFSPFC